MISSIPGLLILGPDFLLCPDLGRLRSLAGLVHPARLPEVQAFKLAASVQGRPAHAEGIDDATEQLPSEASDGSAWEHTAVTDVKRVNGRRAIQLASSPGYPARISVAQRRLTLQSAAHRRAVFRQVSGRMCR